MSAAIVFFAILLLAGATLIAGRLQYRRRLVERGEPVAPFIPESYWRRVRSDEAAVEDGLRGFELCLALLRGIGPLAGFETLRTTRMCLRAVFALDGWALGLGVTAALAVLLVAIYGVSLANPDRDTDGRSIVRGLVIAFGAGLLGTVPTAITGAAWLAGAITPAALPPMDRITLAFPLVLCGLLGTPLALYGRTLWRAGPMRRVPRQVAPPATARS